jgi:hypothetical protein
VSTASAARALVAPWWHGLGVFVAGRFGVLEELDEKLGLVWFDDRAATTCEVGGSHLDTRKRH